MTAVAEMNFTLPTFPLHRQYVLYLKQLNSKPSKSDMSVRVIEGTLRDP